MSRHARLLHYGGSVRTRTRLSVNVSSFKYRDHSTLKMGRRHSPISISSVSYRTSRGRAQLGYQSDMSARYQQHLCKSRLER